jgi:acetyltransferase-like isoleucine patch superfamily enzyme
MTDDPMLDRLLDKIAAGERVAAGEPEFDTMDRYAREAQRITAEINTGYHDEEEIKALMERLIGKDIPGRFRLFPPVYSDFGKNISIGEDVFINSGCCFQDQGGVSIGKGCQIGHQVVFATIDHGLMPEKRHDIFMDRIVLEENVWVGSHATILKGVRIGHDSVVAAGAVVTKDVPPRSVVAGVPAKVVKTL